MLSIYLIIENKKTQYLTVIVCKSSPPLKLEFYCIMFTSAIIVTYCPNEFLLERLFSNISNSVNKIFVIDNTPTENLTWLSADWFKSKNIDVEYIALGENHGIAKAQNIGIQLSLDYGCDHIIFFDQDSAPPIGLIRNLEDAEADLIKSNIKVGAIGPLFLDEKTRQYSFGIRHKGLSIHKIKISPNECMPVSVDYIISSGSLIRTSIFHEIGNMREELFIDWVDIEWGLRAKKNGYENFIIPSAIMLHSIGDEFISIGGKQINLHNDMRSYYIVRNACYLVTQSSMSIGWRINASLKIPVYVIFYAITSLSKKRLQVFWMLVQACKDGFCRKLGKAF